MFPHAHCPTLLHVPRTAVPLLCARCGRGICDSCEGWARPRPAPSLHWDTQRWLISSRSQHSPMIDFISCHFVLLAAWEPALPRPGRYGTNIKLLMFESISEMLPVWRKSCPLAMTVPGVTTSCPPVPVVPSWCR